MCCMDNYTGITDTTRYQKQHILFYLFLLVNLLGYLRQNSPKFRIKEIQQNVSVLGNLECLPMLIIYSLISICVANL